MGVPRLITVAAVGALALSSTATATAGATPPRPDRPGSIQALLARMTLAEKVGQLFVTYAYGDTATTTAPSYTAQNQALYGVDNGAELVDKYHLGGVIYFSWS